MTRVRDSSPGINIYATNEATRCKHVASIMADTSSLFSSVADEMLAFHQSSARMARKVVHDIHFGLAGHLTEAVSGELGQATSKKSMIDQSHEVADLYLSLHATQVDLCMSGLSRIIATQSRLASLEKQESKRWMDLGFSAMACHQELRHAEVNSYLSGLNQEISALKNQFIQETFSRHTMGREVQKSLYDLRIISDSTSQKYKEVSDGRAQILARLDKVERNLDRQETHLVGFGATNNIRQDTQQALVKTIENKVGSLTAQVKQLRGSLDALEQKIVEVQHRQEFALRGLSDILLEAVHVVSSEQSESNCILTARIAELEQISQRRTY